MPATIVLHLIAPDGTRRTIEGLHARVVEQQQEIDRLLDRLASLENESAGRARAEPRIY